MVLPEQPFPFQFCNQKCVNKLTGSCWITVDRFSHTAEITKGNPQGAAFCNLEALPRIELGNKGFADLCLTAWLCRHIKLERETRFELATPALARRCSTAELFPHVHGASGQNRTVDTRIFSPLLYQLSYRGIFFCKKKWRPRSDLNWRSSPWQGDMLTATPRGRIQSTCLVYRLSGLLSTLSYNIFDEFFFIF